MSSKHDELYSGLHTEAEQRTDFMERAADLVAFRERAQPAQPTPEPEQVKEAGALQAAKILRKNVGIGGGGGAAIGAAAGAASAKPGENRLRRAAMGAGMGAAAGVGAGSIRGGMKMQAAGRQAAATRATAASAAKRQAAAKATAAENTEWASKLKASKQRVATQTEAGYASAAAAQKAGLKVPAEMMNPHAIKNTGVKNMAAGPAKAATGVKSGPARQVIIDRKSVV